jgi:hypothetical protein
LKIQAVNFGKLQKPREDPELFIVMPVTAFSFRRNPLTFLTKDMCERERERERESRIK